MDLFLKSAFWYVVALLWAFAEIELEGKYGWSEKAQTWYRTVTHHPKSLLIRFIMFGKPLTGYHIPIFLLVLLIAHAHFFMGIRWSIANELSALALYLAWPSLWDNLWLFLNPHYGFNNIGPEKIWWYSKSIWLFGKFPLENVVQWMLSIVVAFSTLPLTGNKSIFISHMILLGYFAVFSSFTVIVLAPLYKKFYFGMRTHDDRDAAEIFHN